MNRSRKKNTISMRCGIRQLNDGLWYVVENNGLPASDGVPLSRGYKTQNEAEKAMEAIEMPDS